MEAELHTIAQQWDPLFALCDDDTLFRVKAEGVSAWDIGRHVGHVAIVVNLIAGAIENMLENPDEGAGLEPVEMGKQLLQVGAFPRGRGKAPDMLIPQGEPVAEDIKGLLQQAKEKWDVFPKKAEEITATPATFAHFVLGNFTSAQWVRFNALHTEHHFKIMRDILEPDGHAFPE